MWAFIIKELSGLPGPCGGVCRHRTETRSPNQFYKGHGQAVQFGKWTVSSRREGRVTRPKLKRPLIRCLFLLTEDECLSTISNSYAGLIGSGDSWTSRTWRPVRGLDSIATSYSSVCSIYRVSSDRVTPHIYLHLFPSKGRNFRRAAFNARLP